MSRKHPTQKRKGLLKKFLYKKFENANDSHYHINIKNTVKYFYAQHIYIRNGFSFFICLLLFINNLK
tara:strand:+ start:871 stop:1071 length:201 start_codon:yes stop_codon:yes gene_type:complete